ncbi:serine protease 27-like [Penaeus monodon]|uniref:serine protease 27-like n=1 Tax=Penaeus monodon TaxID=6687 RepID=UPI0018A74128|nr:serine protease 27-like [Penaeus monodon]
MDYATKCAPCQTELWLVALPISSSIQVSEKGGCKTQPASTPEYRKKFGHTHHTDSTFQSQWCGDPFQKKCERKRASGIMLSQECHTLAIASQPLYCGSEAPVFNATDDLVLNFKSEDGLMPGFNCTVTATLLKDKLQPIVKEGTQTSNSSEKQTRCGEKYDVFGITRIVGGEQATPYEYPWQVGLVQTTSRNVFCGGSIITRKWVLTAAHCAASMIGKESRFKVLVGAYILSSPSIIQQNLSIRRIILHENYNSHELDSDIAFLEVDPIEFSQRVGPVCLPDPSGFFDNVTGTVTGWGTLKADGEPSNVLMEVDVPTMTNAKCRQAYGDYLTENMLCAGYPRGGKDSCQGDSGGPLVYQSPKHGRWEQIGIVSWGSGCAGVGTPGVYTRLTSYIDWINSVIKVTN